MRSTRDIDPLLGGGGLVSGQRRGIYLPVLALLASIAGIFLFGWRPTLARGVWLDEAYTLHFVSSGWSALWRYITSSEANMGLYYLLLLPWRTLDDGVAWLRLFSLLCFAGQLFLLWCLARRYMRPEAALWVPAFTAMHFFCMRYGLEIRGYALAGLLCVASTLAWLSALDHGRFKAWALYVLTMVAAAYCHFFALLLAPALVVFATLVTAGGLWKRPAFYLAHVLIGLLVLPLAWFILSHDQGQLAWVPPLNATHVLDALVVYAGAGESAAGWQRWALLPAAAALLFLGVNWGRVRGKPGVLLGLCLAFIPMLLLGLLSLYKPAFIARYLAAFVPFWLLALVLVLQSVPGRHWRNAVLSGWLLLLGSGSIAYGERGGEAWRQVAQLMSTQCHADEPVVFYAPFSQVSLAAVLPPGPAAGCRWQPLPFALTPATHFMPPEHYPADLSTLLRGHGQAWLIRHRDYALPTELLASYRRQLRLHVGACVQVHRFEGIWLERYSRTCAPE